MNAEERARLRDAAQRLQGLDCGDNSCRFAVKKGGMRTNGGCRCLDRQPAPPFTMAAFAVLAKGAIPMLDALDAQEARAERLYWLLKRIGEWDHLTGAADGPFWKREIEAAIADAERKETSSG